MNIAASKLLYPIILTLHVPVLMPIEREKKFLIHRAVELELIAKSYQGIGA